MWRLGMDVEWEGKEANEMQRQGRDLRASIDFWSKFSYSKSIHVQLRRMLLTCIVYPTIMLLALYTDAIRRLGDNL